MNKTKNCFGCFNTWFGDKLMYWEIDYLRFRDKLIYWQNDFWNNILSFVLNHTHHIYVSNIYKVLDNTSRRQMKYYIKFWEEERGF